MLFAFKNFFLKKEKAHLTQDGIEGLDACWIRVL